MDDIKNIVESLLFVAEEPLTIERLDKNHFRRADRTTPSGA